MAQDNVIRGVFGTSYRSGFAGGEEDGGGEGEVVAPEGAQGVGPGDAGDPGPGQTAQDVVADLEVAMLDARAAATRLVNVPAPGVIPLESRQQLLSGYAQIEQQIRTVVDRLQTSSSIDAQRDAQVVRDQAVEFVRAVEELLQKAGVPYAPASRRKFNFLLWGGVAAAVAVVGYVSYRAITHKPILPGTSRAVRTRGVARLPRPKSGVGAALAGAAARGRARGKRLGSRAAGRAAARKSA